MASRPQEGVASLDAPARRTRSRPSAATPRRPSSSASSCPARPTCRSAGRVIGAPELEALADASLDGWLTEGRFAREFSAEFAKVVGRSQALPGRLGLTGQPAGRGRDHVAPPRAPAPARRRGDHARARLLDHGRPALPVRARAGLRGRRARHLQPDASTRSPTRSATARARSSSPTASATRSTWTRVAELCREHDLRPDRGLLRRPRVALRRAAGGQLRPGRHVLVLPRPPHDHGRGRRRGGRRPDLAARARLPARVGPRLLVPARA